MIRLISLLLLSWCLSPPLAAQSRSLEIPLNLRQAFIEQLLARQVFAGADTSLRVWEDGQACNYLDLAEPEPRLADGHITTRARASAQVGTAIAGRCLSVVNWQGYVEVDQQPALGIEPGTVQFRVTDSRVLSADGETAGVVGTVWKWVKKHVQPRFERLQVDLNPLLGELRQLLPQVYPQQPAPIQRILEGISLQAATVDAERLTLTLQLDLPPGFVDVPMPADEPVLTPAELERWQQSWRQWDAFLTHFIRQAGQAAVSAQTRAELLAVLIEARRDLLPVLTRPDADTRSLTDLFVKTWQRLKPVLQDLSEQLPAESALHYLTFMAAADMLATLESIEGQTGLTLNADALRRLARLANPDVGAELLQYSTDVDPQLRTIFGFGPPLPRLPPALPPPQSQAGDAEERALSGLGGYMLAVRPMLVLQDSHYVQLVERLNGWAPTLQVLDEYLPLVQQLLDRVVGATLNRHELAQRYKPLFRPLVLATAWQESCWRQYIKQAGEVTPIRSHAGAVGIMQVNQNVWRGFYELDALQYDVGYNAMAGAEIVHHYLVDYAIARKEHEHEGGMDNLVRATYAIYNGGPSHRDRYRRDNVKDSLKRIDQSFWHKYQKVREGDPLVVAECYSG